jgi:hypothetical protein
VSTDQETDDLDPEREERRKQPSQPGPIYDRAVRIVTEDDPDAFCAWLGEDLDPKVEIISGSFAAETLHADFVARVAPDLVHVEYIGQPDPQAAIREPVSHSV